MNNPRVLLWLALAAILLLNYQAWMKDYGATPAASPAATSTASHNPSASADAAVPQTFATETGTPVAGAPAPAATSSASAIVEHGTGNAPHVHVRTDVLDMDISLQGGTITRADLLHYPRVKGSAEPVRLMNEDSALSWYVLNSGIAGPGTAHPTQAAEFTAPASQYDLGSAAQLLVPLTWTDGRGVSVTKTFTFHRGDYRIDLQYAVDNRSSEPWQGAVYGQIQRYDVPVARSYFNVEGNASHGPAVGDGTKYRFLSVDKPENHSLDIQARGGWIAAVQLYFVGAVVPEAASQNRITLSIEERKFQLTVTGPLRTIAPDTTGTFKETLFVGPKLQDQLSALAPYLDRVADYGTFTLIALPLFWVLGKVHGFFGNWGVAIILTTFLLKLLFYPLSEASGRSMAKMKTLCAAHQEPAGHVQGRQGEARARDDGALQAREGEPGGGVPADHHPDSGVSRLLLGAARKRRDASGALRGLDSRPLRARSGVHPARDHGRGDVGAIQAESDAHPIRCRRRFS
jgi:YidC/Oxa1 family membrane protein insertase